MPGKKLVAIDKTYALASLRAYRLGGRQFIVHTAHASSTTVNIPYVSQRMARWLSFFAVVTAWIQTRTTNVVAEALLRRRDFGPAAQISSEIELTVAIIIVNIT